MKSIKLKLLLALILSILPMFFCDLDNGSTGEVIYMEVPDDGKDYKLVASEEDK